MRYIFYWFMLATIVGLISAVGALRLRIERLESDRACQCIEQEFVVEPSS